MASSVETSSYYECEEVSCIVTEPIINDEDLDEDIAYKNSEATGGKRASYETMIGEDDTMPEEAKIRSRALDLIEKADTFVEKLRREALRIEDEKESLVSTLDSLKNNNDLKKLPAGDYKDICHALDILIDRCLTVELRVHTLRSDAQEEALHRVNICIDALILKLRDEPANTRQKCRMFLRACCAERTNAEPYDTYFETAISNCSSDDQKRIRRRLQGLLEYVDSWVRNLSPEISEEGEVASTF